LKKSVLFVCIHNAGRSQIAAGYLKKLAGEKVEVRSAGSIPAEEINQNASLAMNEVGIDISKQKPKLLNSEDVLVSDYVITMGCGDSCPVYPGKTYLDWDIEDPAGQPIEEVRKIRDEIAQKVRELLAEFNL
jgi:arsenate reductase (thioredoxin)